MLGEQDDENEIDYAENQDGCRRKGVFAKRTLQGQPRRYDKRRNVRTKRNIYECPGMSLVAVHKSCWAGRCNK